MKEKKNYVNYEIGNEEKKNKFKNLNFQNKKRGKI